MKQTGKKIAAVLCALVIFAAVLAPTVYALDSLGTFSELLGSNFGDILGELFNGMGGGNNNAFSLNDLLNNPNGLLSQLRERLAVIGVENVSDGQILDALKKLIETADSTSLTDLLNNNDAINRIAEYLQGTPTTLPTTEPPTTEEPTTEEPTTEEPTALPSTTAFTPIIIAPSTSMDYSGADPYTVTAEPTTATEPSYIYNSEIPSYTSPVSTVEFTPTYQEEKGGADESGNTMKLVIGFALLSASAVAIVVVLLKMRKTNA